MVGVLASLRKKKNAVKDIVPNDVGRFNFAMLPGFVDQSSP
jgi:hypothetical protein